MKGNLDRPSMGLANTIMERGPELSDAPGCHDPRSLIERCNQGDRRAWEEFYTRYFGMISFAVRRYCAPRVEDHDDLVHEVFINLFKALKHYDSSRPLEAYILEISRRVTISGLRKSSALKRGGINPASVRVNAHDSTEDEAYTQVASSLKDQENALMDAQETFRLRESLARLSESCREVLALRYDKGLSYKEIAARINVKEGALRVRVQRCLDALAREYLIFDQQEV